jgi:hypothetical protein
MAERENVIGTRERGPNRVIGNKAYELDLPSYDCSQHLPDLFSMKLHVTLKNPWSGQSGLIAEVPGMLEDFIPTCMLEMDHGGQDGYIFHHPGYQQNASYSGCHIF